MDSRAESTRGPEHSAGTERKTASPITPVADPTHSWPASTRLSHMPGPARCATQKVATHDSCHHVLGTEAATDISRAVGLRTGISTGLAASQRTSGSTPVDFTFVRWRYYARVAPRQFRYRVPKFVVEPVLVVTISRQSPGHKGSNGSFIPLGNADEQCGGLRIRGHRTGGWGSGSAPNKTTPLPLLALPTSSTTYRLGGPRTAQSSAHPP